MILINDIINFSGIVGGPLDILGGGGGCVRSKKKFTQGIELEKKSCKRLEKEKKFVQPHEID